MSALLPSIRRAVRWHRPLMFVTGASVVLLAACVVALAVDDRVLTGAPIWLKPAKFAISTAVYSTTLAWLLSLLHRWRRLGWALGTAIAVLLAVELAGIVVQAARGELSHFNFTTPLNMAIYLAMGGMVVMVWVANLVVGVLLLVQRHGERSTSWAIRLGVGIALAGMAVAFFMTNPTATQLQRVEREGELGVIGAHSVGVPDGGPGLPLTGWSTVAGDLRVPHFVGLHGLQALILLALVLVTLGRRAPRLRPDGVRLRVVLVGAGAYTGVLALTTWQALRGQSVVRPDALTLTAAGTLAAASLLGLLLALGTNRRQRRGTPPTPATPPEPTPADAA